MQQTHEVPNGYERVEHHDPLTLHDPERGIVISVHERDDVERTLLDKYPYKVMGSHNQHNFYNGTFQSKSHAIEKVYELANEH